MSVSTSVQSAHDELMAAMPEGARHTDCSLCGTASSQRAKEVSVSDSDRVFSEEEHQALLRQQVEQAVADAVSDRDSKIADLEQRNDVLEAEKAQLQQDKDTLQGEFDAYKEQVEQEKAVEQRKAERVGRVQAAAIHLPDDYFSDARKQRWAEMADEDFEAFVQDLEGAALAGLSAEEASELEGLEGKERSDKLAEIRARRQETAQTRETAAFSGGKEPVDPSRADAPHKPGTLGQFLSKKRPTAPANGS